jgi:protein subunit release factor B
MSETFVSADKETALRQRMAGLDIREADIAEKFVLGGGPGGQNVNRTASCVYLKHRPSGIEVKCQWTRSRALNRFLARRELCDELEARVRGAASARQQEIAKIRRQKRRRSRRQRERMLEQKHRQSAKKDLRRSVGGDRE